MAKQLSPEANFADVEEEDEQKASPSSRQTVWLNGTLIECVNIFADYRASMSARRD